MSNLTTLNDALVQELLQKAIGLYALYNLIGRGHLSEEEWVFAYIDGRLPEVIKRIKEQAHE